MEYGVIFLIFLYVEVRAGRGAREAAQASFNVSDAHQFVSCPVIPDAHDTRDSLAAQEGAALSPFLIIELRIVDY